MSTADRAWDILTGLAAIVFLLFVFPGLLLIVFVIVAAYLGGGLLTDFLRRNR